MNVKTVKNSPIDSNCYIVYQKENSRCLIIDPGTPDMEEVINFLIVQNLTPEYIILTHEHFDHIWGVTALLEYSDPIIIANKYCIESIKDPKKNLSLFYDQKGFFISKEVKSIELIGETLIWEKFVIKFISTPGHSDGSISILINENLFSGDLMINGLKTITKLPSGNKKKLLNSLKMVKCQFSSIKTLVYPGHGESFFLDDIDINMFL
jgi:hydroxyacylglutathione hydrolase